MGQATPEKLVRELRLVLKLGNRPPRLAYRLAELPLLCKRTGKATRGERWDIAVAVVRVITMAAESLGDGPYGQAAQALFGTSSDTRGLPGSRRRRVAADLLNITSATFVRHWEKVILLDMAVIIATRDTRAATHD